MGKERGLVSHGHITAVYIQHYGERERACQSWSHHCCVHTVLEGKREGLSVMVTSLPCTYSTGTEEKGPVSNVIPALLSSVTHSNFNEEFSQSFGFHCVYIHCIREW